MRRKTKLNEGSLWLLRFLVSRLPQGYSVINALPTDHPPGVSMMTMRGLERRGYVRESDQVSGIFYATPEGVEAAKAEGEKQ